MRVHYCNMDAKNISIPRKPMRFFTLAGVENIELRGDAVVGQWWHSPGFTSIEDLQDLEDFANWPVSPNKLLQFTKKYGALTEPARADKRFRVTLKDFKDAQNKFRSTWDSLVPSSPMKLVRYEEIVPISNERFVIVYEKVSFRTSTMFRLMHAELLCVPAERIRKCRQPDCTSPYFIARHLGKRYCSEPCAQRAQIGHRRKWYDETGRERRQLVQTKVVI